MRTLEQRRIYKRRYQLKKLRAELAVVIRAAVEKSEQLKAQANQWAAQQ